MAYGNGGGATLGGYVTNEAVGYDRPSAAPSAKAGEAEGACKSLGMALGELNGRISYLEERLSSVLTPHGPATNTTQGNSPDPIRSPHVQVLVQSRRAVEEFIGRMEGILSRLEL